MENFKDSLKKFMKSVEKLFFIWEGLTKRATKHLSEIETLSDQLISSTDASLDVTMSGEFSDLKENLIYKILMALEKELEQINCLLQEVAENTDNLSKLAFQITHLSVCPKDVPSTISMSTILEFICDSTQCFMAQYATLKTALLILDFREGRTIKNLRSAFVEHDDLKAHIQCGLQIGKNVIYSIDGAVMQSDSS